MAAPKLDIDHHNVTFLIGEDPYEDNLKRKSIFFAVLLQLNFGVPGRSTIVLRILKICVSWLGQTAGNNELSTF